MLQSFKLMVSRGKRFASDFIAVGFWASFCALILGVDRFLLSLLGDRFVALADFRFVLFTSVFLIVWVALGTKRTLKLVGKVVGHPLLTTFRLGKRFYRPFVRRVRSWSPARRSVALTLALGYVLNVRWFFRQRVLLLWLAIMATVSIVEGTHRSTMSVAVVYLVAFVIAHMALRILAALNAVGFDVGMKNVSVETLMRVSPRRAKKHEADPRKKRRDLISQYYLLLRLRLIVDGFSRSPHVALYYIGAILYTVMVAVTSLTMAHIGLSRIDPAQYEMAAASSPLAFLHLTVNSMLSLDGAILRPVGVAANWLCTAGAVVGVLIALIYATVFLGIVFTRTNDALASLSKDTNEALEKTGLIIMQECGLDPVALLREIETTDKEGGDFVGTLRTFLGSVVPPRAEPATAEEEQ